jgi:YggT family protein
MDSFIGLLSILIRLLQILFIARFIAQLFDMHGGNPITRFLMDVTEPILAPVRRLLPSTGGIDFSPTIVLLGLFLLQMVIAGSF